MKSTRFSAQINVLLALLILLFASSCAPRETAAIPTLMVLPSIVPTEIAQVFPTNTVTLPPEPFITVIPPTNTPDLLATENAGLQATNDTLLLTLASAQTLAAQPTQKPSSTPAPTATTDPVQGISPMLLYTVSTANLRSCANRDCPSMTQVSGGQPLMATGQISGETVNGGNSLWYRVDWLGQQLFVYSALVSTSRPVTATPVPTRLVEYAVECTADSIYAWLDFANAVSMDMFALSVATMQAGRDRVVTTPYPTCAANARSVLISQFDAYILSQQASDNGDYAASIDHLERAGDLIISYSDAVIELINLAYEYSSAQIATYYAPEPYSPPSFEYSPPVYEYSPPSSGGGSGGCPSMSATCSQLTCAQAYACLAAGNGRLDRDNDGRPCEAQCG